MVALLALCIATLNSRKRDRVIVMEIVAYSKRNTCHWMISTNWTTHIIVNLKFGGLGVRLGQLWESNSWENYLLKSDLPSTGNGNILQEYEIFLACCRIGVLLRDRNCNAPET